MKDVNARFCSIMLRQAKLDLTGRELKHFNRNCSALKIHSFRDFYLVEWSRMSKDGRTFSLEVQADNANDAKSKAINNWLEHHAPTVRERHRQNGFLEDGTP